jgi:hypothetical protein
MLMGDATRDLGFSFNEMPVKFVEGTGEVEYVGTHNDAWRATEPH